MRHFLGEPVKIQHWNISGLPKGEYRNRMETAPTIKLKDTILLKLIVYSLLNTLNIFFSFN